MTEGEEPGVLAEKIDKLFTTVKPKGREYTYEEVARGCSALGGGTFSKTYVWQLRAGLRDNPTKRHLEALAAFFRVPVAYFFDDTMAERIDSQIALAVALRDSDVRDITLRAIGLDDAARKSVARMLLEITELRGASVERPSRGGPDRPSGTEPP